MDPQTLDLGRFKQRLKYYFHQDPVLSTLVEENYFWSGRNIRGKVCLELGTFFHSNIDIILDVAAFTEFLHNASLIHDDLLDHDYQRRGHPTIWAKYGKDKALLLGDLFIAKAFTIASSAKVDSVTKSLWAFEISNTIANAVKGALNELEFRNEGSKDVFEQYFEMAAKKTGALFSLPILCLAIAAGSDITTKKCLKKIFSNLAVAYQIKDDQADFLGAKNGRTQSSDLINDRPNLYHLLASSDQSLTVTFSRISNYQNTLIESAKTSCNSLPYEVGKKLEKLLIPFVSLKPLCSSHLESPLLI